MNTDKPIPTLRTDAASRVGPIEVQRECERLETELSTALASLAAAQVRCAVKDGALRVGLNAFDPLDYPHTAFEMIRALADNCAAPWMTRYDAMRVALGSVTAWLEALVNNTELWRDGDQHEAAKQSVADASKALEDEPK